MAVPYYEPRNVEIRFEDWSRLPKVFVDGPDDSPHRYDDGSLCMWYPSDPSEEKWVFEDGLFALLNLIQAHLFREAYWRENNDWAGPEAPHLPAKEAVTDDEGRDGTRPNHRGLRAG